MSETSTAESWIFTFGGGHTHPDTGEDLSLAYVRVPGDYGTARAEMIRLFGPRWAFQYDSPEAAGADQYGMREVALPKAPTADRRPAFQTVIDDDECEMCETPLPTGADCYLTPGGSLLCVSCATEE